MLRSATWVGSSVALTAALSLVVGCREDAAPAVHASAHQKPDVAGQGLLLAMAVFGEHDDGSPKPLPARLGILSQHDGRWHHGWVEDPDSNVFHKAMAYVPAEGPA